MKNSLVSLIPLWILFHVVNPQGVQNCGSYDDERFPDPKSCYSYYECHNGVALKKTCSFGMVYNCFFKFCTFKAFAPCCRYDPHPPPTENGCLNLGIKIPNPFVCNKYFECKNWQIREVTCPRGTRYDFIDMKCVDSGGCRCAPGTVIDNSTETTTQMSKETTKMTPAHIMTTQEVTSTDTTPTTAQTSTHETTATTISIETSPSTTMTAETTQMSTETSKTAMTTSIETSTTERTTPGPTELSTIAQMTTTTSNPSLTTQTSVETSTMSTLETSTELSTYTTETSTAEMTTLSTAQVTTTTSNPSITTQIAVETSTMSTLETSTEMSTFTSETTIVQTSRCPINGIRFPDTSRCTKYYQCQNGDSILKSCRFGFFYNCFLQRCSIFTYTPCCKDDQYPVRNNEYCTNLGKKVPNPYDCTKYFECKFFRIQEFSCPRGQLFDWVTNMCVSGNTCECIPSSRSGTTGSWETTVASRSTTTENPWAEWFNTTNDFEITESTFFIEGRKTTSLSTSTERSLTAVEEIIVSSTEASETTSTNSLDLCLYDGIKFPDTKTCRNYYECINGEPISKTCPLDLVFNCFLNICTLRAFTPCCKYDPSLPPYDDTCFGLEVKIPDPLECNKYYQCKDFKIMEEFCPRGQKYDWLGMNCVDAKRCHCAPGL